ncbi:MAG: GNAT family N-acetyltransferase [Alphaproteobacteria bacterium]|nr:GNAT family N-acetyltransferase [Alphaproteobacteria bacterium]
MATVRPYRPEDEDALYRICLETGLAGADATHLYRDPRVIGHVYAGPYGALEPQSCFVAEDEQGVAGYVIGAADTYRFEKRLESEWWPKLRARYPEGSGESEFDARMIRHFHHPPRTPRKLSESWPAHLHIDLLPRLQGKGMGRHMIDHWLGAMRARGVKGVHLGVGISNARAVRFYRAYGFSEISRLQSPYDVIFFGIAL